VATTELPSVPPLGALYAKAAVAGVLPGGAADLPDRELVVRDVAVDREHLAAYAQVCGFRVRDRLPATYVHVLAFPLSVALMAERAFPFALPGLVHVANRIEVRRPVTADERLDLRVRTADLRPHEKGRQFDVLVDAEVDGGVVWSGTSTYLRRGEGGDAHAPSVELPLEPPDVEVAGATWRVPADTGRRYAAVSGDRNPIHLNPVTARLFGFPRPIAHGMWTAARCAAALEGQLPPSATHTVRFGKPLPLPRTVTFATRRHDHAWTFAVRDPGSGAPHLTGSIG
jgi:acyl dehydratase